MSKIKKTLNIPAEKFIYWSDSTIVLSWLKMPSSSLKTFVANRVGEIQSLTSVEDWYHIRTFENPADILSRGVTPQQLNNSTLWWHGPQFLRNANFKGCDDNISVSLSDIPEIKPKCCLAATS
jgi:hypothetical protein